jgi:DNA-binding NarL/FixJ family response regulator
VSESVRVLVADDSDVFRGAAVDVVNHTPGFEVVAAADSGETAVACADSTRPDLVLIDVRMPGLGGLAAAKQIAGAHPQATVVLVTADSGAAAAGSFLTIDKRVLTPTSLVEVWRARVVG